MRKFTLSCDLNSAEDVGDVATLIELFACEPESINIDPSGLDKIIGLLLFNFCDYAEMNLADTRKQFSVEVIRQLIVRLSDLQDVITADD